MVRLAGALGLTAALLTVPLQAARADTTTIRCLYRAPQGNTVTFVFDLPKQVLVEGPNIFTAGTTENAPLTVSDNSIAWTTDDGWRMVLDRTTMVLSGNGIDAFDCVVARKQL